MDRNFDTNIIDTAFADYAETVWAYVTKTNTKGANYDPYRNTGYSQSLESPYPVKAIVSNSIPWSLQKQDIGEFTYGAISLVIKKADINAIKFAEKIEFNSEEYTPYSSALGNKVQISRLSQKFYKVIIFLKGNDSKKNQY